MIRCLKRDYGLDVVSIEDLSAGGDRYAAVCRASANGGQYFVKLRRGPQAPGATAAYRLLRGAGIEHVISPIETTQGKLAATADGTAVMVFPFVEGTDAVARPLDDSQWLVLGRALRKIHDIDLPQSLVQLIPRENFEPDFRKIVDGYLHPPLNEHAESEVRQFGQFLLENKSVVEKLVNRAEELSVDLRGQDTRFVLCHSDIHARNVLVASSGALYIIDWDEPILAPRERDLMFIGGGVANVWNEPRGVKLFYQGYGKIRVDKRALAYYRSERAIVDFASFGQEMLSDANTAQDKQRMLAKLRSGFAPRGVVDIALGT